MRPYGPSFSGPWFESVEHSRRVVAVVVVLAVLDDRTVVRVLCEQSTAAARQRSIITERPSTALNCGR